MKYMMMMHAPRAGWKDAGIGTWPPEDIKAHIGFMMQFNKELKDAGRARRRRGAGSAGTGAHRPRREGRRAGGHRRPVPEAKEFLAGFWIIDVREPERAYAHRGAGVGRARQRRRADEHARSRCAK